MYITPLDAARRRATKHDELRRIAVKIVINHAIVDVVVFAEMFVLLELALACMSGGALTAEFALGSPAAATPCADGGAESGRPGPSDPGTSMHTLLPLSRMRSCFVCTLVPSTPVSYIVTSSTTCPTNCSFFISNGSG